MNIMVDEGNLRSTDQELLFGEEPVHVVSVTDLPTLLVHLGIYASKSKARQAGRDGEIPMGWSEKFKASKKAHLWIWRPSEG